MSTKPQTFAEFAAARGMTPQQFDEAMEPIPGWPGEFDHDGHGRVTWFSAPLEAREDILLEMLERNMYIPGLDRPPAGILREPNRKLLYIQEPNGWRQ